MIASHRWRAFLLGIALLLTAVNAEAGDASLVAERGGFLLGAAYRCGMSAKRLEPSASLVHQLVTALSEDDAEAGDAEEIFTLRFLESSGDASNDTTPSCTLVRRQLTILERHQTGRSAASVHFSTGQSSVSARTLPLKGMQPEIRRAQQWC